MVLRRDVRVVRKWKWKDNDMVMQQVECFVPIGRESLNEDGSLMEIRAVSCYDCEGNWKGEKARTSGRSFQASYSTRKLATRHLFPIETTPLTIGVGSFRTPQRGPGGIRLHSFTDGGC